MREIDRRIEYFFTVLLRNDINTAWMSQLAFLLSDHTACREIAHEMARMIDAHNQ